METKTIMLLLVSVGCITDAFGSAYAMFVFHDTTIGVCLAAVSVGFAALFLLLMAVMIVEKRDRDLQARLAGR